MLVAASEATVAGPLLLDGLGLVPAGVELETTGANGVATVPSPALKEEEEEAATDDCESDGGAVESKGADCEDVSGTGRVLVSHGVECCQVWTLVVAGCVGTVCVVDKNAEVLMAASGLLDIDVPFDPGDVFCEISAGVVGFVSAGEPGDGVSLLGLPLDGLDGASTGCDDATEIAGL